ncbi:cytochrome P450 [Streptomyces sp. enrichment culture]|uniref:cytochrome P450 n=1 Tax=Streptomyces sp. enrichment culture TaxID=1795815 RepID=UPI003F57A87B
MTDTRHTPTTAPGRGSTAGRAPVAPGRLPVLGHALQLSRGPIAFLESLRGIAPVVRVDLGGWPLHVLTDPALIHTVLVGEAHKFGRGRIFEKLRPLFGNGIATTDGAFHRKQRRLMQPAFQRNRISRYAELMCREADAMAASWTEGREIRVDREMRRFALSAVAGMIFSGDVDQPAVREVHRSFPIILEGMLVRTVMPKAFDRLPIPLNRRFNAAATRLRSIIDEVVAEHGPEDRGRDDLISLLLASKDPETGDTMSAEQVRDELITILFGGTETASTTLAWIFHELARHPDVEARVHAEIDEVVGDRPVRPGDLPSLTYTKRVFEESLRLHSPLLFTRRPLTAVTLGGVDIPAGAELAYSPYALHRDPELFRDPTAFDTERWNDTDPSRVLPRLDSFIPFGAGQHKCIGDAFAVAEILTAVASVGRRWRLRPAPGSTVKEVPAGIPLPDALPMIPVARD